MMPEGYLDSDVMYFNVVQLLNDQCVNTPDAAAIQYNDNKLSYLELNATANRLANFLIENNYGKNNLVGLCLDRSLELGIGILGIIKAGAAYVPFDPENPSGRISNMLHTARCRVIITSRKYSDLFNASDYSLIIWEDEIENINKQPSENPEIEISKDDLLYVIFTSGSTGEPKGVAMRHEPLVNLIQWQFKELLMVEPARTLQYCSINFDVSFQEILTCWSTGGCLVMLDDALRYNPLSLLKFIEAQKIERLFLVYSSLQQLCQAAVENKLFPPSLKDIITGGEQVQITSEIVLFFKNVSGCVLHNHYGPTETNVVTTYTFNDDPDKWDALPPIGKPIDNDQVYILDENLYPVKKGVEGELYVGGVCLARGYINREDLTRENFIKDPFSTVRNARMYKTGDLVKQLPDGNLQYVGRKDGQVKIRGFRIELAEVEFALTSLGRFKQVAVVVREDQQGLKRLVAYMVPDEKTKTTASDIRKAISGKLPDYMIPSAFVFMNELPRIASGKIDRKNLPIPELKRPEISTTYIAPATTSEKEIAKLWCELLLIDKAGVNDNFFDLGGNSLLAIQFITRYARQSGNEIPIVKLYEHSTIKELCNYLQDNTTPLNILEKAIERKVLAGAGKKNEDNTIEDGIAIIGMSGRFPGANNVDELWNNLLNGIESTTFFKPAELDPHIEDEIKNDPNYVAARGIIEDADKFDAAFFGINPKVAEITDPQQRIFLELAWEALEQAGYAADLHRGLVGVFAGAGYNSYYVNNVIPRKDLVNKIGSFQSILSNEKDYVATLASYMLDLKGPAMSIHTACSTSLVAVIEAVKSLREFECDIALAGGIAITSPVKSGHTHSEGSLFSKDGHTRPFSADATGTTFSDGGGVVVLKRCREALRDGDQIYAVIRGIGLNNDGHDKASFAAPSVQGQAAVITMAQADAGIDAETISYIEAHGTATPIGDPIEVEALNLAFRNHTPKKQFCAIGSVKGNFGHLTAAAGVAGLIKTALALKNKTIPASINLTRANPAIDFANSPFFINAKTCEWTTEKYPRRAGVSSFGLGGTNAHVILEELPQMARSESIIAQPQLLLLSAKTKDSLNKSISNLSAYLKQNQAKSNLNLADIAYTLQTGRKSLSYKKIFLVNHIYEAIQLLQPVADNEINSTVNEINSPDLILIISDEGSEKSYGILKLVESERVFRDAVIECCDVLKPLINQDLGKVLFADDTKPLADDLLVNDQLKSILMFIINYASARLLISAGIVPKALLGEGTGHLVCACIAGVMHLQDALKLLVQNSGSGGDDASAKPDSQLMELAKNIHFHKPHYTILSSVTAEPLSISQVTDPAFWIKSVKTENNLADCMHYLRNDSSNDIILFCGFPDKIALHSTEVLHKRQLLVLLYGEYENVSNPRTALLQALGQLWLNGIYVDWTKIDSNQPRMKVSLPTYPFDRKRFWVDPPLLAKDKINSIKSESIASLNEQQNLQQGQLQAPSIPFDMAVPGQQLSVADQNMMFSMLLQQMQLQQQLLTMMILENNPVAFNDIVTSSAD